MRRTRSQPDNVFEQRLQPFPMCSSISCFLLAETTWLTKSIHSSELKCFIISPVSLSSAVRCPAVGGAGPAYRIRVPSGRKNIGGQKLIGALFFSDFANKYEGSPEIWMRIL